MKRFTTLIDRLETSHSEEGRLSALLDYLLAVSADELNCAIPFLLNAVAIPRVLSHKQLLNAAAQAAGLPDWLMTACRDEVGDIAELTALLAPRAIRPQSAALNTLLPRFCLPLRGLDHPAQQAFLSSAWEELDLATRRLWHRLLLGTLHVRLSRKQLATALSHRYGILVPLTLQRFETAPSSPTIPDWLARLTAPASSEETLGWPMPWAHPGECSGLDDSGRSERDWQCEWVPYGQRLQLVRRSTVTWAWSADGDLLNHTLPKLIDAAHSLEAGLVLEGIWVEHPPELLTGQSTETLTGQFWVQDVLEYRGSDQRDRPLCQRSECLTHILGHATKQLPMPPRRRGNPSGEEREEQPELFNGAAPSQSEAAPALFRRIPALPLGGWDRIACARAEAQARGYAGILLRSKQSLHPGSQHWHPQNGLWLPNERRHCTAVLLSVQVGDAGSDYSLGIRREGGWLPIARIREAIPEGERAQILRFIQEHTTQKFGSSRLLRPALPVRLSYDYSMPSRRHKAGLKLVGARWEHLLPETSLAGCSSLEEIWGRAGSLSLTDGSRGGFGGGQ